MGDFSLLPDIEVRNEDEANEAIAAGADVIMLNNIISRAYELASVAQRLRECWRSEEKRFLLETSGGITESNLRESAIAGECDSKLRRGHMVISRQRSLS